MITTAELKILTIAHDALTAVVKQERLFKELPINKQFLFIALLCLEAQMRRRVKADIEVKPNDK